MPGVAPFDIPVNARDPGARDALEQLLDQLNRRGVTDYTIHQRLPRQRNLGRDLGAFKRLESMKRSTFESHYVAGQVSCMQPLAAAPIGDQLYAIPFVLQQRAMIDELSVNVTVASGGFQLGIYDSWDGRGDEDLGGRCHPHNLVYASGVIPSAPGWQGVVGLQQELEPGRLYWLVYWCAPPAQTIDCVPQQSSSPCIGTVPAGAFPTTWGMMIPLPFAGATLPDEWGNAGAAQVHTTNDMPAIYYRLTESTRPLEYRMPLYAPKDPGWILRRIRLHHPDGLQGGRTSAVVNVGVRDGSKFSSQGRFDSTKKRLVQGDPFLLTGQADLDLRINLGDVLETQVELRGWPPVDLGDSVVQWDLTFAGGK